MIKSIHKPKIKIPLRDNKIFDSVLLCLLFVFSLCYFLYGYQYFELRKYHYDEAISTYGALRILNGDIPYKDFWTLYPPGQFYVLAVIFKIFGISIKTARIFSITVLSLTVCGIYILVKKISSRLPAFLAFLFLAAILKSYMVYNRPGQLAMFFYILCCLSLLSYFNSRKEKTLCLTGILAGIITLCRQDFGFYIFCSTLLVIFLKRNPQTFRAILFFFSGFLMASLPVITYLAGRGALGEFINDAVIFPVTSYINVRDLPFPRLGLDTLIFYAPILVFLLTALKLAFNFSQNRSTKEGFRWLELFLLFSGIGLFGYASIRIHMGSLLPVMIPAIILFILLSRDLLNLLLENRNNNFLMYVSFSILFILSFAALFYPLKYNFVKMKRLYGNIEQSKLDISRASGFYDDSDMARSQAEAIKFIQRHTGDDERIFVGNLRHDKVVNSDVMFYFLSQRHSATAYYELHPGLTNTKIIQKQIISDLAKAKPRYVILWSGAEDINEPNDSSKSSAVKDLDNFIEKNYKMEKDFGYYKVLSLI